MMLDKFFGKRRKEIDFQAELAKKEQERLEGERAQADFGTQKQRVAGTTLLFKISVIVLALGVVFMVFKSMPTKHGQSNKKETQTEIKNNKALPNRNSGTQSSAAIEQVPAIEATQRDSSATAPKTHAEIVQERRLQSGFKTEGAQPNASYQDTPAGSSIKQSATSAGELQSKLTPVVLNAQSAAILPDRNLLITQGTMIDCALATHIVSTVTGMTSCYLTRNVYSANGRVILLDKGSKVVGQYQGAMQQGQARIFVLWTRVETPQGVVINLDSPGADALGGAGLDGYVDTHFWERYGGAIMLSLLDDVATATVNEALDRNKANGNQINFSMTSQAGNSMAEEALRNSINIPPTLYKHQGDRINIFVARDLDFRSVYELKSR